MSKITSNSLLKKKSILLIFYVFYCFFLFENAFTTEHWKKQSIYVFYEINSNTLQLGIAFTDSNFGSNQEHGYLEWCDLQFSTDGVNYKTLAMCEVSDHISDELLWVKITNKLANARIKLEGCVIPKNGTMWEELTNPWIAVKGGNSGPFWGILSLLWFAPKDIKIKYVRVTGKWTIKGLCCPDYFDDIHDLSKQPLESTLKTGIKTVSKQNHKIAQGNEKLFTEADAIVIQGAERGEKIYIYTTAGALIKSIVVNEDLINIQLPAKQLYIVNVGHKRYKVAL